MIAIENNYDFTVLMTSNFIGEYISNANVYVMRLFKKLLPSDYKS